MQSRDAASPIRGTVLAQRALELAKAVLRMCRAVPARPDVVILRNQLPRSATSIVANYRAACRARSRREFAARLGVAIEEGDETLLWLELLASTGAVDTAVIAQLAREADEITAILVVSRTTALRRMRQ